MTEFAVPTILSLKDKNERAAFMFPRCGRRSRRLRLERAEQCLCRANQSPVASRNCPRPMGTNCGKSLGLQPYVRFDLRFGHTPRSDTVPNRRSTIFGPFDLMTELTSTLPPDNLARTPDDEPKVKLARSGALRSFTLNRPKALNAFDDEMRKQIADEIPNIARDPDTYVVALLSNSAKAFCAGGDVRVLTATAKRDMAEAKSYFRGEYYLNWLLDCFSKPTVSLIDGICMGSGAGLTCYNTHRVAGANYRFAMPETAIGLFPDVGVAHVLAQLRWPVGLYLGLTGRSVTRADAQWLGLTTHCIEAEYFPSILEQLADAQPIDPLLDGLHRDVPPGPLQSNIALIEDLFSGSSLSEIMAKLSAATGPAQSFAEAVRAELLSKSPISLAITDRHIRSARRLNLRETLIQDYRIAVRCLAAPDFYEGVRALLIDKDQRPVWQPQRIEDVSETAVGGYFEPLGADDLALPTRAEMQASRV